MRNIFLLKCSLLIILFCWNIKISYSQNSLNGKKITSGNLQKLIAFEDLAMALINIEKNGKPDSVIHYANQAYKRFRILNDSNNSSKSKLYLAIGYQQKNKFDTSIIFLNEILRAHNKLNDSLKADCLFHLGINYYRNGDKKQSLKYFLQAIPIYQSTSNFDGLVLSYSKTSDVLVTDFQFKEAEEYKNKAIALLPKLSRPYVKIFSRNLISRLFMDLRRISSSYIDSSIFYAKEAYALMKQFGYFTRAYQTLGIICDNYFIKGDFESGIYYCRESLKYRKNLYPGEIIIAYSQFSDYYELKRNYKMALPYLDSIKLQLPKINVQYYRMGYYERLYRINKGANNLKEAISALENYNLLKDSLYNVKKSKEINELEQRFSRSENEKKILELNKEKEIASINTKFLVAGVIASFFAIVIIIFFFRQSLVKNKLKTIETEQRLNRARMDPHFFFNILSSLRSFVLKENNATRTADYLTKYAKIMRQSLESSYNELISLETELEFLNNYFEIQKLRYPAKFNYEITIADNIESSEIQLPSMIIQPFAENAIEHGFSENIESGKIILDFSIQNQELKITISDNGSGINNVSSSEKKYPSRATQIVKDRLFLLNKQYQSNARFDINNQQSSGLTVILFLPLIYSK